MVTAQAGLLKPPSHKYDIIQVFRFVAALMVIILHSTFYASERLSSSFGLYNQGANGVRLFFVISGFVMILSSENLKNKPGGYKIFAIKRIIRIVPIYWIITTYKLLVLIFASTLILHAKLDALFILKSYFFIPALNIDGSFSPLLGVGWTLNFEMFFYLMFTIALALRINTLAFLSLIFIPLSILSFYKNDHWPDARFYANPIVLDFLYGMIIAKLILNGKKVTQAVAPIMITLGLIILFVPAVKQLGDIASNTFVIGIAGFLVIYGAASIENSCGSKMPAWLIYLGGASYSLYLIHPIVAPFSPTILKYLHIKLVYLSIIMSVVSAVIAGTLFYKYCEKPLTKFTTKLSARLNLLPDNSKILVKE